MKVEKCFFQNGTTKAISFTYDDAKTEDIKVVEILNKYGLKGTFNINSGFLGNDGVLNEEQVKTVYENHEVACHTVNHPFLINMSTLDVIKELILDRENLERITGKIIRGYAYPFGNTNKDIREISRLCNMEYARGIEKSGFELTEDYYDLKITSHHNDEDIFEKLDVFEELYKKPWRTLPFMNIFGHSYEFTNDNNWDRFEQICKKVSTMKDTWFATNIEIVDYLKALDNLKFSCNNKMIYNPNAVEIYIGVDRKPVLIKPNETIIL